MNIANYAKDYAIDFSNQTSAFWNDLPQPVKTGGEFAARVVVGAVATATVGSLLGAGGFTYLVTTCIKARVLGETINIVVLQALRHLQKNQWISKSEAEELHILSSFSFFYFTAELLKATADSDNCLKYLFLSVLQMIPTIDSIHRKDYFRP